MKRNNLILTAMLTIALCFTACSSSDEPENSEIAVTSVTLNKTTLTLAVGDNETLTATIAPTNATNKTVTWSSSNNSIATVDNNGKVSAIAEGTATITAKSANNKTATCAVTVRLNEIAVESISLNKTELSMAIGENEVLTATITPNNATGTVAWVSLQQSVATVDNNGKVTALATGTTIIIVTAGGKTATCTVTVQPNEIPVESISLNKTELTLEVGENEVLTATITPGNATGAVTWTSSQESVAIVDNNGKVTALATGTTIITVTAGGKNATCVITVHPNEINVESISLNETSLALIVGDEFTLTATILPNNATNQNVVWTSSNTSVANVVNGELTAIAAGTATITATTEDGNKIATCEVSVDNAVVDVESISLNKTSLALIVGNNFTLTATILPNNATNQNVVWTSSNTSVANVVNGVVTAVAAGTTTITATADGKTATCQVSVDNAVIDVESISLNETSLALIVGNNFTLTATILPLDATNQNVVWTSSDNTKVSVVNGVLTAIAAGTATITAQADGKSTTCTVTVYTIVTSGQTGGRTWVLTSDDVLTISGNGAMPNYSAGTVPWYSYRASIKTIIITDGVTSIGNYAFYYCTSLTSVTIGNSVTSIGNYAFSKCTSLTNITIPNSVKTIGDYAFYDCTGLRSITIGNSVTSIGNWALDCSGLTEVRVLAIVPPTVVGSNLRFSTVIPVYVPQASLQAYKQAIGWSLLYNLQGM